MRYASSVGPPTARLASINGCSDSNMTRPSVVANSGWDSPLRAQT
jgi:hypothetical protein